MEKNKIAILIIIGCIAITGSILAFTYKILPWYNSNEIHSSEFKNIKIAIVDPTFTGGAYNNAFYDFYNKYDPVRLSFNSTTEGVDLMTGIIPDRAVGNYNIWYISFLLNHFNSTLPGVHLKVLKDQDVDEGLIFDKDGTNSYNLLIIGHEEYVTEKEYDNFRSFVSNGGKIIFLDGNVFYAEVHYNPANNSVTLVKGHGYEFDGKIVKKSVFERWSIETSEWVGANYYHPLVLQPHKKLYFTNNPFNATFADEEDYVTNQNDRILLDYGFSDPTYEIATYELNYGQGNVIMLGIYGERVISHQGFLPFFDSLVKGILSNDPSSYNYLVPTISTGS